jgi:hypothetical protein
MRAVEVKPESDLILARDPTYRSLIVIVDRFVIHAPRHWQSTRRQKEGDLDHRGRKIVYRRIKAARVVEFKKPISPSATYPIPKRIVSHKRVIPRREKQ